MQFAPLAAAAAWLAASSAQAAERPIEITLAAGMADEVCLPLKAGQALQWRFSADVPVAFNLHHHVGPQVIMPVDLKATAGHEGRHVAGQTNDWCLMWTAPRDRAAVVRGSFTTDDAAR